MATKMKKAAAIFACQTKEQMQDAIMRFGCAEREHARIKADEGDQIAAIRAANVERLNELEAEQEKLLNGIQYYAEAHRAELCPGNTKTANVQTGEISWRIDTPSVKVNGEEAVIELLRARGLDRFVRVKESVNREAIKADPEAVAGIPGIKIVSGVEKFSVKAYDVEVAQ
jgi:phage host-nuclease inhibitor protein Gam